MQIKSGRLRILNENDLTKALAALAKSLKKSLKEKGNDFNTEGVVNVALFFEEFIVPLTQQYAEAYSDELNDVARKVVKKLEKLIEASKSVEWLTPDNKKYHLKAYNRMLRNMNKFIKKGDLS